jgi:creatinine amidohydrolase
VQQFAGAGRAMAKAYWDDLTTEDFRGLDRAASVVLFPVAATEQHGPHLPLSTDACIGRGIVARALELAPGDLDVLVLPQSNVGLSLEHARFAGTLSHGAETLIAAWCEVGAGVAAAGLRKLVFFNSHGGQPQIVDIVAQRLRARHGMLVVRANSFGFGMPDGLFDGAEVDHGLHGGAIETSMMLHLAPDLVRMDKAADFASLGQAMEGQTIAPQGPAPFAWETGDLNPAGVVGNAAAASAAKGAAMVDHLARALVRVLEETRAFPLDRLKGG